MNRSVVRALHCLGIVLCVGIAGLFIFPHAAARLGVWLSIETQYLASDGHADAIIILGGNTLERTNTGIELYHQLVAPRLVLTGYDPGEHIPEFDQTLIARNRALAAGVPERDFTLLETTSTLEDAQQIANYIRQNGLNNVVIVSDWSHARRAICTTQMVIGTNPPAMAFFPSSAKHTPDNWWTTERGLVDVFTEIAKMGFYTIRHGIPMWACFYGDPDLLLFPLLLCLGFVVSVTVVEWMRRNALRLNRVDIPNERSSHTVPTPRGGGLGISLSVIALWLVFIGAFSHQMNIPSIVALGFPIAAVCAAGVGWTDDRYSLSSRLRLLLYALICSGFIAAVGIFDSVGLPLLGHFPLVGGVASILTLLWLVGFLNIFNFMDGIDGLAGSQAVIASLFWLLVCLLEGQFALAMLSGLIAATSLGFLLHNMPPARIFMGDVGSAFLGFALAAIPLMAYVQTGNARLPVVGALFVAPFILDGTFTIVRRAMRRENIFKAHRSHIYQKLFIAGSTHAQVTKEYRNLMLLGGLCGMIYYAGNATVMLLSLLIMVTTFSLYGWRALRMTSTV
jgi:UDP-N-acetylmuramyl pentapeptide phosphotransferase/UDP-N-acetylglucosamine-1-phosphate transferase/uncharacterized SAM-binding protein YcdF (DUF218 family)